MPVAARYVNRELIAIFAVTLAFLLLVAVGGRFIGYLQEAATGKLTGTTVLVILYYRLPEFVQLIAPFALYVAMLLTVSRLHADREMVVLQSAGADTGRLLVWTGTPVIGVGALVAVLSLLVTPLAQRALDDYLSARRAASQFETVKPGVFHVYDGGGRVTYSESVTADRRTLGAMFLAESLETPRQVTVWAERAQQRLDPATGSQYLVLRDGVRYEGRAGRGEYRVLEFAELSQRLDTAALGPREIDTAGMPTSELGGDPEEVAEWHWRIGLPLFAVVGALLALGLARVKPRQGRFAKVVPAVLTMFVYYLLLLVNKNALAEGTWPAALGLWGVHAPFVATAGWLLHRFGRPVRA